MIFPHLDCPLRTDNGFRLRIDAAHHKCTSPIEELPIDMIVQIPVADSLHLIDLGIMKRMLYGWNNVLVSNSNKKRRLGFSIKWNKSESDIITKTLRSQKLPIEIHRAVRGLDDLCHWKGTEFRNFLYYISIVILKDHLSNEYYSHFLCFFCAITICSFAGYQRFLNVAEGLLKNFVENFISLYGIGYIGSNMHNLIHLVEDVRHLGILSSFAAYPFENKLYQIKRMLRKGNTPLVQIAKRFSEKDNVNYKENAKYMQIPKLKKQNHTEHISALYSECTFFYRIETKLFILDATQFQNQFFLTHDIQIIKLKNIIFSASNTVSLYGANLKNIEDFFVFPFKSSYINIYISKCEEEETRSYKWTAIKCKLVPIKYKEEVVFLPLLHTNEVA